MNSDRSSNPALSQQAIDRLKELDSTKEATISGTTLKALFFLALTAGAGFFGWQAAASGSQVLGMLTITLSIVALVAALITAFKPQFAAIGGSVYALAQGYVLGAVSQIYNVEFSGIVLQAVGLTGAIFFVSLWFFQAGLIKVTNKFRIGVIIATLGIFLFYLVSWVISLFSSTTPFAFSDGGTFGIIFSLIVVFVATLNLFLDFDLIQRYEKQGAPKQFEWYGAFALVVTIIWLYIEALRLLGRIRG
jgi:uncharacterized YccA/Bax inhibitor family protein